MLSRAPLIRCCCRRTNGGRLQSTIQVFDPIWTPSMSILRKSTNSFCTRMIGVSVFPSRCNTTSTSHFYKGVESLRHFGISFAHVKNLAISISIFVTTWAWRFFWPRVDQELLACCVFAVCLLLATDCFLAVCWIPSELNMSDGPSRHWERLRAEDVETWAQQEKSWQRILKACYPDGPQRHHSSKIASTSLQSSEGGSKVSGSDPLEMLAVSTPVAVDYICRVQELKAAAKNPNRKSNFDLVCRSKFVNHMFELGFDYQDGTNTMAAIIDAYPDFAPKHMLHRTRRALQGWHKAEPQTTVATASSHVHGDDPCGKEDQRSFHSVDVHSLPEAGRALRSPASGLGTADAGLPIFCHPSSCSCPTAAVKGGTVRQVADAGLSIASMVGSGAADSSNSSDLPDRPDLRQAGEGLEVHSHEGGTPEQSCSAVSTASLRSKFRPATKTPKSLEVKQRGRWSSDTSVKRYEAHARISQEFHLLPEEVQRRCVELKKGFSWRPKDFCSFTNCWDPEKEVCDWGLQWLHKVVKDMLCVWLLVHCLWLDIEYGSACDLLQPRVLASLLKFIQNHSSEIVLVWMGTPCTTWSRARKNDGGPPPLRNGSEWLWGFPNLPARDLEKISQGNALLDCSVQIAQLCSDLQIAWVLENPFTSRIWLTEPLQACLLKGASFLQTEFCAFGVPWQKSTGLIFQNFDTLRQVSKHCKTHHGRCSFPGRKHIILSGKDSDGVWLTRRAQPYPYKLCWKIADALISNNT